MFIKVERNKESFYYTPSP